MIDLLQVNRERIGDLCRRHGVARLEVFGSASDGRFQPERSDVDFLVEFNPDAGMLVLDQFFGLRQGLEDLLGRPVDLVGSQSIRNPHFLRQANRTRELLYAA